MRQVIKILSWFLLSKLLSASTTTQSNQFCSAGGQFDEPAGIIYSPAYPKPYPINTNEDCQYMIVAKEGYVVSIKFDYFLTDTDILCRYACDYVALYDGKDTRGYPIKK